MEWVRTKGAAKNVPNPRPPLLKRVDNPLARVNKGLVSHREKFDSRSAAGSCNNASAKDEAPQQGISKPAADVLDTLTGPRVKSGPRFTKGNRG